MMVCQPFNVVLGVEPGIHDHYLFGIGRSFLGYGADDFLECGSVLAVTLVDGCSYKQPLCIHHRGENHDLAVVALFFTAAEPAQVRVFHSALKVGIGDVEKKYLLLQLEHVAHALVEPVLKLPVNIPKTEGTPIERILGNLHLAKLEELRQRSILLEIPYCLELRVWINGTGDDLHHGKCHLIAAPTLGV